MGHTHEELQEKDVNDSPGEIRQMMGMYHETRLQRCLHVRHVEEREKVIAALLMLSDVRWLKQAKRVQECCSHGRIYVRGDYSGGNVGLWIARCGVRCCPYCSKARSQRVEGQIREYLAGIERPRHIVLTRRHDDLPLDEQIGELRSAWKELRLSGWGREKFRGGIYAIEVKLAADGRWHPHLHIVYDGMFIDQRELARAWGDVAGGSSIVWISHARVGHARYLAKYVGKPAEIGRLSIERLAEYIEATGGLRMIQPFGGAHGPKPSDGDPLPPPPPASYSVDLSVFTRKAAMGHVGAERFVRALVGRYPVLKSWARAYVDLCGDPDPPADIYSDEWRERTSEELDRCVPLVREIIDMFHKKNTWHPRKTKMEKSS